MYHYLNQMELAGDELEKGLALEPQHPLLRTSCGYQQMRLGNLPKAIEILEGVMRDDATVRIAVPTLACATYRPASAHAPLLCFRRAALAAAEADSEMAYRLATYFAVEGDSSEALHWLRRAIYLGNENYPWFSRNPAWNALRTNTDFERILEDLKRGYRKKPAHLEEAARSSERTLNRAFRCKRALHKLQRNNFRLCAHAHRRTPRTRASRCIHLHARQNCCSPCVNLPKMRRVIHVKGNVCPPCVWPESCRLTPACSAIGSREGTWCSRIEG